MVILTNLKITTYAKLSSGNHYWSIFSSYWWLVSPVTESCWRVVGWSALAVIITAPVTTGLPETGRNCCSALSWELGVKFIETHDTVSKPLINSFLQMLATD